MIGAFQPWPLIVVLVIAVMVFGLGTLPELGRAVGHGLRELKRASGDGAATPAVLAALSVVTGAACPACNTAAPSGALLWQLRYGPGQEPRGITRTSAGRRPARSAQ